MTDFNNEGLGDLVRFGAAAAAEPAPTPPHDLPFVTQLIASAWDWPGIPCRRRFERGRALGAYDVAARSQPNNRTRRVV